VACKCTREFGDLAIYDLAIFPGSPLLSAFRAPHSAFEWFGDFPRRSAFFPRSALRVPRLNGPRFSAFPRFAFRVPRLRGVRQGQMNDFGGGARAEGEPVAHAVGDDERAIVAAV
jgi:hypothetical protein